MVPGYGDSFTVWCDPTPGTVSWPFEFKGGYIDRAFVKVKYRDEFGQWWPSRITRFENDGVLRIEPPIPPSQLVMIYRDTPKDRPIVLYGRGGALLSDESRNAAARQSLHVLAEMRDMGPLSDVDCLCNCVRE